MVQKSPIQVKLADFGISKLTRENTELRTRIGTEGYIAPEVFGHLDNMRESSSYTSAVDMWSLGCLLYYVLTKTTPFSTFLVLQDYAKGHIAFPEAPLYEKGVSIDGRSFIQRLLRPLPETRPKASEGLLVEWIIPINSGRLPEIPHVPETVQESPSVPITRSFGGYRSSIEHIKPLFSPHKVRMHIA